MLVRASISAAIAGVTAAVAGAAELSVTLSKAGPIARGEHLQIAVSHNAPDGAGLVVSVVPDIPKADYEKFGISDGLLVLRPVPVSGAGQHTIDWDTKSIGCDPTDAPMWCEHFRIGRYRIKAEVFDTATFALLGLVPRSFQPRSITVATSAAFEVVGQPDMTPVISHLDAAASTLFAEAARVGPVTFANYIDTTSELRLRDGMLCKSYAAKQPFSGGVRACMPADIVGPFGVHFRRVMYEAKAELAPSISFGRDFVPYDQALDVARVLADAPYQKIINANEDARFRVWVQRGADGVGRPAGHNPNSWTRRGWGYDLSSSVANWSYRTQDQAWIFTISEVQSGGSSHGAARFADNVMVRVERDGTACVVRTLPLKLSFEPQDGAKRCP